MLNFNNYLRTVFLKNLLNVLIGRMNMVGQTSNLCILQKNRSIGNKSKAKGIKVDLTPATVKALCAYASIEATLKAIYEKYDPVDCT